MKNKHLIMLMMFIFLFSFSSAIETNFGSYIKGENLTLKQTCGDCSYINITSVQYPNGTTFISNVQMTKDDTLYTYEIDGNLLDKNGVYLVTGRGDPYGNNETFSYDFTIRNTGNELDLPQVMLYLMLFFILCVCLLISLYVSIVVKFENSKDIGGNIIRINYKKYIKLLSLGFSYVFFTTIIFFAWNLIYAYSYWENLALFFRYSYTLLMIGALLFLPVLFIISIVHYINDKKIEGYINKMGLSYNGKF